MTSVTDIEPKQHIGGGAVLDPDTDTVSILLYLSEACRVSRLLYHCLIAYGFIIIMSVLVAFFIYLLYNIYWNPISYVKELTEVGFEHIPPGCDRSRRVALAQAMRRKGTKLPPPYPNGWFAVAESRDLAVGTVLAVDALGQNLCVYRDQEGVARVVNAYCPHLGANLGIGGRVCGSGIVCPFHHWRFDDKGVCVAVPDGEPPKGVSIKSWRCVEAEGGVWVWHDAESRKPLWHLQSAPESVRWGYRGRSEFTVSAHIQEIPENGSDLAHLNVLHSPSLVSDLGTRYPFLYEFIGRHIWNGSWKSNANHTATMTLNHHYNILHYNFFHTELNITQLGPGHVRLRMDTPIGPFFLSQSVTPIGPMLQKVVHRLYSPVYNAAAASILLISEGKMIERDIKIWNNKRFVSAPTFVKSDKTIRRYRTWYAQFYTEHSLSFTQSLHPLDW